MIESWNYCSNWCFSGWRFFRSLIPPEAWRTLIKSKCLVSFLAFNNCSLWRRLGVVEMLFFASCHLTFVEVMHRFVFFSHFRFTKYLWCYSGYVSDGFSCDMYSFFRCFPRKSHRRATFGSTKRNITTIEVALTGRSWKKFSFLDAQSVKLAFRATYRNYTPNFVRENEICVGV